MGEKGISTSVIGIIIVVIIIVAGISAYVITSPGEVEKEIKIAKIGWVADLTGPYSCYGTPGSYAAIFAVETINNELYPDGIPIGEELYELELSFEDYGGKFEDVPLAVKRLLDDEDVFIIMADLAFDMVPVLPDLEAAEVPVFVWLGPSNACPVADPWILRYRNTEDQTIPGVSYYMANEIGVERVADFHSLNPGTVSIGDAYVAYFEEYGVDTVYRAEYEIGETTFYSYLAKAIDADVDCIASSATVECINHYIQAKEVGYEGYYASYTGMTEVQAEEMIGPDYADYIQKVYQTEGVGAFTHEDLDVRQWGFEYFERYGEYPIDLVPWCWDQIMVAVSAAMEAGTVTDGQAFKEALDELPYDFELLGQLKTPMYSQRGDKFFDDEGQALMTVQICAWTEEGCKIPVMWMEVREGNILSTEVPSQELIDTLIAEWHERQ